MRIAGCLGLLLLCSTGWSQTPPDLSRGQKMLAAYMRDQTQKIADACLTDLTTREQWEQRRPELRRQFFEMMGLWPLPAKTDLKPQITGTVEGEGYVVEKLLFQSWPGLYVPAHVYRPKTLPPGQKLPAILYVCGHGNVVENGVWYGSKVSYQYHPAWFATHGYICIILDTLQLSEIPGTHHGTHHLNLWWWHNRGYTPAGIELWNGIRALDYLETRADVDPKRMGVTGRSGGGATSWWVAAADERIQAAVPVAGIADLKAHLVEAPTDRFKDGVISGHCDCMYMVNQYRWDFPMLAALIAPRPLLLGNSDEDTIFPVAGYRRIADKVKKVYGLYGAEERFQLLETKGPHKDTPELRIGINRWMNRWLKKDTVTRVEDDLPPKLTPKSLKVLGRTPADAINDRVHELFIKPATIEIPTSPKVAKEWWKNEHNVLLASLRTKVFAGWPPEGSAGSAVLACDTVRDGVRFQALDFQPEPGIELRLFLMTAADVETPKKIVLSALDEQAWEQWCRQIGEPFHEYLQRTGKKLEVDQAGWDQNRTTMKTEKVAFAAICPRGIGPTRWAVDGTPADIHIRRRFALLGQTLDGQRVWDVRSAITSLRSLVGWKDLPLRLQGERQAAAIALYAGLFESSVNEFDLWHLPASHHNGPYLLNVARVLDLPVAVALASPRPMKLWLNEEKERANWAWPLRLQEILGVSTLKLAIE